MTNDPETRPSGREPTEQPPEPDGDAAPKGPPTLDEEISELEGELAVARGAKKEADTKVDDLDAKVKELRKLRKDLAAAVTSYRAAHDQLTIEQQALDDYEESELQALQQELGDEKVRAVGQLHERTAAELAQAKADVETAEGKLASAKAALPDLEKHRSDATARVDALQKLAATIKARHGQIKAQRDQVTAAHEAGRYALAYWLLAFGTYHKLLDGEPRLIEPEELPAALREAVKAKAVADAKLGAAQQHVAECTADLAEKKAHLADREANGERELRNALTDLTSTAA